MHHMRLASLMTLTVLCAALPAAADVVWQDGSTTPSRAMRPDERTATIQALSQRADKRRVIVQFVAPLGEGQREALDAAGVRLLDYLGSNSYFAKLRSDLDVGSFAALPGLQRVEAIQLRHKLHSDLAVGVVHPWSVVERGGKEAPKEGFVAEPGTGDESDVPTVAVYVLFHRDARQEVSFKEVIGRHGGTIHSTIRSLDGVVAHLPADRIQGLADEDSVRWVEPPLPQMSPINDSNRTRVGAGVLQDPPYGLDGSGVTVLVYDAGKMFAHQDFGSRLTIGASDTDGISDHATHVGGTIGGDGSASGGQYRGMAPAVEFVSYGFEQEGGLQEGFLYTDPGDLEADYTEAINVYGADLSNNSIGTNTAPNGFPCEWEGNYGVTGALIDAIARGSIGSPFRIVWANGNERSSGACGTTYVTTAPPACAKNHITVGALNSDTDGVTGFTSWGPADDGRLKPDISAPGCEAGDDGGVTSTSSSGSYNVKCGTSMASPTVTGVSALMLQQHRLSFPEKPDFLNATLKAILATTAEDVVNPGPDYQSGYGSVRAVPAVELIQQERYIEGEVAQGGSYNFIVLVGPSDTELKVTIAWDDPPGTPNVNPVLVNDLDLRVVDPGGATHYPWTLDPANPANNAVRTVRDGLNNIEQVVIDNPAPGAYRVEVEGFAIAQGPTQTFGAAASPSLINCSSAGIVAVSPGRVACDSTVTVQVIDCDLNLSDTTVDSVDVTVVSDSDGAGETLTLVETAAESATFTGTVTASTTDVPGTLLVTEGDTIVATYVDADDGEGGTNVPVQSQATVDCTAPQVTEVTVTEVNPRDAEISIGIDEPARVEVQYGTTCGAPTNSTLSFALSSLHDVRLSGLIDDTTYFFTLDLEDQAGNTSSDDNGGACYTFTTPEVPDFFTEQFGSATDLEGLSVTFTPNGSVDFYALCAQPLTAGLPTDPAGGIDLGLSDDQPGSFVLADGKTVQLYGQSHSELFVGPNGYITFGSGDSTYLESLTAHFSKPRVAATFDDLNPASAGEVSWRQLDDRVAVSWEGVPEYNSSNSNTFQIEMFFDGRIRLNWLHLDTDDFIAGLSEGSGLDPDFLPTDLSEGTVCNGTPPFAEGTDVATAQSQSTDVQLLASDDGLPGPPAELTYRVTLLPGSGTLTDPGTGRIINAVPYDLWNGGSIVRYTPNLGYAGFDAFAFRADDGGETPDGGEGNQASVFVEVGGLQASHEFLVDDSDPGWSTEGDWEFGQPTGGGSNGGDPTGGFTGSNVYGYNLSGDYDNDIAAQALTSPALDLSSSSGTVLEYRRWLGVGAASADQATVLVSTDGTVWRKVWSHVGGAISETDWSLQSHDISQWVDGEASVQLRWVMGRTGSSQTYPGWNIDDIRLLSDVSCAGAPGEVDNLRFGAAPQFLEWDAPADSGGLTPYYDLLRTGSPEGFSSALTCVESNDGSDTSAFDSARPADGELFYYLVRAENECGLGPVGGRTVGDCP